MGSAFTLPSHAYNGLPGVRDWADSNRKRSCAHSICPTSRHVSETITASASISSGCIYVRRGRQHAPLTNFSGHFIGFQRISIHLNKNLAVLVQGLSRLKNETRRDHIQRIFHSPPHKNWPSVFSLSIKQAKIDRAYSPDLRGSVSRVRVKSWSVLPLPGRDLHWLSPSFSTKSLYIPAELTNGPRTFSGGFVSQKFPSPGPRPNYPPKAEFHGREKEIFDFEARDLPQTNNFNMRLGGKRRSAGEAATMDGPTAT